MINYTQEQRARWLELANDSGCLVVADAHGISRVICEGETFPRVCATITAEAVAAERHRLGLDTPLIDDWHEGVKREVAHQINQWGSDHDAGKKSEDWFWLLGYLGGKALHAVKSGDLDKAKHHTISTGAALVNWFRALNGADDMRPGIMPPKEVSYD